MAKEYRPCPICHGTNSEECTACQGVGRFPYPWILPGDEPVRSWWTAEEDEVVDDAPSGPIAYERYCEVFGENERSYASVYSHWYWRLTHPPKNRPWSEAEIEVLDDASDSTQAISAYHADFGDQRTRCAIRQKYHELQGDKKIKT